MKIGIPQALLYYKYSPLWDGFFSGLGVEVVLSGKTDKFILNLGVKAAENETCLPLKVFYGHVLSLKDKVDAIFIPRVVSIEKDAYTCPKFLGLPDMISALGDDLPQIISCTIDRKLGLKGVVSSIFGLGRHFTDDVVKIALAIHKGFRSLRSPQAALAHHNLLIGESSLYGLKEGLKIGLLGHPYNVFDPFINMNILDRLVGSGVEVVTIETNSVKPNTRKILPVEKELFWTYEREVVSAALDWLDAGSVDGIVHLLSFACGPDSLVQMIIEDEAKKRGGNIPIMSIVIDEHSGSAGILTRLEAFLDMIERRKVAEAI